MIRRLFLSRSLLATVEFEVAKAIGTETGGVFVGYVNDEGLAIPVLACGPGPRAKLGFDSFEWDAEHVAEWLFIASRAATRVAGYDAREWIVGRWHKHTLPIVRPSAEDAAGALSLAHSFELPALAELIVACDGGDVPLHFGAFLFDRDSAAYEELPTTRELHP